MKGFLHRIAASAIRPEPRLRPVVGSIYAGDLGIDSAEEKPSLLLDPPPSIRPQAAPQPAPDRNEARPRAAPQPAPDRIETRITHVHEPSPSETPVRHEPLIAPPRPVPPSLASVVSQLTTPRQKAPVLPTYLSEHGSGEIAEESGPFRSPPAWNSGRAEEDSRPSAITPLVTIASQSSELRPTSFMPIIAHREPPPPEASAPRDHASRFGPGRKPADANAGEEIQIHIGRIEVIAVPPQGASAPAASRSRATSLDDYLKRRNGRA